MTTLTLKNVPQDLHARLKACAAQNRRSLNSEILVRLEGAMADPKRDVGAEARRLRVFTARMPRVDHGRIGRYKNQGRA